MRAITDQVGAVAKADLRAAIDAIDAYFDANVTAAGINAAIPQPARGALSTAQKTLLVKLVMQRRYG